MHAPDHLREAFLETFCACTNGDEAELSVYLYSEYNQRRLSAMNAEERLMWFAGELEDCTDILPGDICADLDLPSGSTYAQACERIREGFVTPA